MRGLLTCVLHRVHRPAEHALLMRRALALALAHPRMLLAMAMAVLRMQRRYGDLLQVVQYRPGRLVVQRRYASMLKGLALKGGTCAE